MLPLNIAVSDLMAGNNSLQIVLLDAEGNRATQSITITLGVATQPGMPKHWTKWSVDKSNSIFYVAPFEASCTQSVSEDNTMIIVECTANREIASQMCTLNGVDIANCKLICSFYLYLKSGPVLLIRCAATEHCRLWSDGWWQFTPDCSVRCRRK